MNARELNAAELAKAESDILSGQTEAPATPSPAAAAPQAPVPEAPKAPAPAAAAATPATGEQPPAQEVDSDKALMEQLAANVAKSKQQIAAISQSGNNSEVEVLKRQLAGQEIMVQRFKNKLSQYGQVINKMKRGEEVPDVQAFDEEPAHQQQFVQPAINADEIAQKAAELVAQRMEPIQNQNRNYADIRTLQAAFSQFNTQADISIVDQTPGHPDSVKINDIYNVMQYRNANYPQLPLVDAFRLFLLKNGSVDKLVTSARREGKREVLKGMTQAANLPPTLAGAQSELVGKTVSAQIKNNSQVRELPPDQFKALELEILNDEEVAAAKNQF